MGRKPFDSTEVGRTLDQYAIEIGLALLVLITATAAWIVSRRRYVKSADFKRGIDALRFEFRRSLMMPERQLPKGQRRSVTIYLPL
jgi:hypothetical protein